MEYGNYILIKKNMNYHFASFSLFSWKKNTGKGINNILLDTSAIVLGTALSKILF